MSTTRASYRPALGLYLAVAVVLYVLVGFFANADLPLPYREGVKSLPYRGPSVLEGWVRFDAGWYYDIAANGYYFKGGEEQSSVAYFPVYPLAIRGAHAITGVDRAALGIAITFAAGLIVALLFYRWSVPRVGPRAAFLSLAILALWPYSWYLFGAVYADALFIALVLAAFSALERGWIAPAALAGAIATATRPVGVAVAVGLLVRQLERRGVIALPRLDEVKVRTPFRSVSSGGRQGARDTVPRPPLLRADLAKLRLADSILLTSIGGFVAYAAYLHSKFGDAFAFSTAQAAPGWENTNDPHAWFKVEFFERVFDFPNGGVAYTSGIVFQGFLGIAALLTVPRVARRFGIGYGTYVALVLAIPLLGSKDFQGLGRYTLSAFPVFAVAGDALASRRRAAGTALAVSAGLLGLLCSAFARGAYVA